MPKSCKVFYPPPFKAASIKQLGLSKESVAAIRQHKDSVGKLLETCSISFPPGHQWETLHAILRQNHDNEATRTWKARAQLHALIRGDVVVVLTQVMNDKLVHLSRDELYLLGEDFDDEGFVGTVIDSPVRTGG